MQTAATAFLEFRRSVLIEKKVCCYGGWKAIAYGN